MKTTQEIIVMILNEVDRATIKHADWPVDKVYGAAIVSEESGEAMRAAVQYEMEGGDIKQIEIEIIQTAATCIRMLQNLEK